MSASVARTAAVTQTIARGEIDFGFIRAGAVVISMPACRSRSLAGVHAGCYELFAHEPIRTIGDLKGKRVGIPTLGRAAHLYLSIMAAHVGLDPSGTSTGSGPMTCQADGAVRRGQGRCVPRLPARAAGAARPQDRRVDPQHGHRQAVVAVFLLHVVGNSDFVREIRSRPNAPCAPS